MSDSDTPRTTEEHNDNYYTFGRKQCTQPAYRNMYAWAEELERQNADLREQLQFFQEVNSDTRRIAQERDDLRKQLEQRESLLRSAHEEIRWLHEQLKEAKRDSERLEWLDNAPSNPLTLKDGMWTTKATNIVQDTDPGQLRQAIDEAMEAGE